ncbi:MAG: hypothetical protein IPO21_13060 [Bacteroidales bacterium]|nr:hypothetical protein [Bacteroidales bacterium]
MSIKLINTNSTLPKNKCGILFFNPFRLFLTALSFFCVLKVSTQSLQKTEYYAVELSNTTVSSSQNTLNTLSNPALSFSNTNTKVVANLSYKNYFSVYNLNSLLAQLDILVNATTHLGIVGQIYGTNNYYYRNTAISVNKTIFKHVSLGLRLKYASIHAIENSRKHIFSPDIGLHISFTEKIDFGTALNSIFNFSKNKLLYNFKTGISYHYSEALSFAAQINKYENYLPVYCIGSTLQTGKYAEVYLGLENSNTPICTYVKLLLKKSSLNVGLKYHDNLGISTTIVLNKKI